MESQHVKNGSIDSITRRRAFFKYLFRMNKTSLHTGSFELRSGNWSDDEVNFDVEEISSDVLLRRLRRVGFRISYFTTEWLPGDCRRYSSLDSVLHQFVTVQHPGSTP